MTNHSNISIIKYVNYTQCRHKAIKIKAMIIKNITLNIILTITLLAGHSYSWNMEENPCRAIVPYTEFNLIKLINPKKYNAEYNINNSHLVALPLEKLEDIFAKISSLDDAIKTALALRVTCKDFYKLPLKHFSKALQHHDQNDKNKLLTSIDYDYGQYYNKLCRSLILIFAGAQDTRNDSLLIEAIYSNDTETVDVLFKENAVSISNQTWCCQSILSLTINPEILKIFIENKVDLNQKMSPLPNILWLHIQNGEPSSEFIKICLDNHVDTTTINSSDGNCLLHHMVSYPLYELTDINEYVKIGKLLLDKNPGLVNKLNHEEETPIDAARNYNKKDSTTTSKNNKKANKQLITLFKQRGGKTAKQLKKDQNQYQQLVHQIKEFSHHDYSRE